MTDLAAEALDRDAAYQRGFDHGRLRAAEDVAKLIDAFNGETRDAYLKAARVALNGYAGALRAPSEPVQGQPGVPHTYTSTACFHGHHDRCGVKQAERGETGPPHCKFCPAPCRCACHEEATDGD